MDVTEVNPQIKIKPRALEDHSNMKDQRFQQNGPTSSDIWLDGIISIARKQSPNRYALRIAIKRYVAATFLDF